jgi:hypothetical protein
MSYCVDSRCGSEPEVQAALKFLLDLILGQTSNPGARHWDDLQAHAAGLS